jgi:uncharacterized membrane protein
MTLDFDEILTLGVSQVDSIRGVWDSLLAGADGHPPLQYLLTRASLGLFGKGLVPLRLPSILGFWCMILCPYGSRRGFPPFSLSLAPCSRWSPGHTLRL